MSDKGLFLQNVIAVIWDFDKTLSPHYMQRPLFEAYGIDENAFWNEVRRLPDYYARAGIHVQRDTCYLGHLLSYVKNGKMPDLTNAKLREVGKKIEFFRGLPDALERLQHILDEPDFKEGDLRLEHYVVSTGLAEIIRGSTIAPFLSGIWGSEFIEEPAAPGTDLSSVPPHGPITQIATFLDNTSKTRAIFEINKGVNKHPNITVNDVIPEEERRVPFKNMLYLADGPSDVPSFSVVRKYGGFAYAVYAPSSDYQFAQVVALHETGRVHAYGPADFRSESQTYKWMALQVKKMAKRTMRERKAALDSKVGREPRHLEE